MFEELNFSAFIIAFTTIFVAELGDKTQLALVVAAAKSKKLINIFFGAVAGFLVADGLAALLGTWIGDAIPRETIKIFAAILFFAMGVKTLFMPAKEEESGATGNSFITTFLMILVAETGDKTQIATGLMAARGQVVATFFGVMLALAVLSGLAIFIGGKLSNRIPRKILDKVAGTLFIVIGLWVIVS